MTTYEGMTMAELREHLVTDHGQPVALDLVTHEALRLLHRALHEPK